jgi:hypothetical protein
LRLYLSSIISDDSDNNNNRISIKNIDGRIIIFDDPINSRRRIMKIIKTGKLSKKIDLTTFYASDKDKTVIKNKLKKMREKI